MTTNTVSSSTENTLIANIRKELGTGATRALRRKGLIPAIVYAKHKEPINITVEEKEVTKRYRKPFFISTVIDLKVGEQTYKVLPKEISLHPITDIAWHVDFVFLGESFQKMDIPIVYEGKERSIGVKRGGFFNIIKRRVTIFAPSDKIPQNITIDVTNMQIGKAIKASDLKLPEGCSFANKNNFKVATIIGSKGSKTEEEQTETAAG